MRREMVGIPSILRRAVAVAAGLALALAAPALWAKDLAEVPGFVDGAVFLDCGGEDALSVEVRLSGTLIRLACSFDPDLCEAIRGIEMVHALILDASALSPEAVKCMRDEVLAIDKRLSRKGWERVALVKEADEEVRVLLLPGESTIDGLVVMALGENEIVFSNIAGPVDLAALRRLGDEMDVPGLDEIDFDQIEKNHEGGGKK